MQNVLEITREALRGKFDIVRLFANNENQQPSVEIFVFLAPHAKLALTEILFDLHTNLTQPYRKHQVTDYPASSQSC